MADDTDVLLKLWEGQWEQARHTESQRATVTNFVITISAAIIGFFAAGGLKSLPFSLLLAILLIALGIYGAVTCSKLYERWRLHTRQARKWRNRIDELHPNAKLEELKKQAKAEQKQRYKGSIIQKIRLHQLWLFLHIMIAVFGVLSVIIIIKG